MTIDHIGAYLYPDDMIWRAVGRITFPVWFFLVGHALAYRPHRDTLRWGLVLAVMNPWLGEGVFPLNSLVTILGCQCLLVLVERGDWLRRYPATLLAASAVAFLPSIAFSEYGSVGFLYALMGHAVRDGRIRSWQGYVITLAAFGSFCLLTVLMFAFTPAQYGLALGGSGLITLYLARFRHHPVVLNPAVAQPLIWLSRHSMQYYVLHRLLLQSLGVLRGTLQTGFRWV
jgi:hypothetical protein